VSIQPLHCLQGRLMIYEIKGTAQGVGGRLTVIVLSIRTSQTASRPPLNSPGQDLRPLIGHSLTPPRESTSTRPNQNQTQASTSVQERSLPASVPVSMRGGIRSCDCPCADLPSSHFKSGPSRSAGPSRVTRRRSMRLISTSTGWR
jgi:hypothetical protein